MRYRSDVIRSVLLLHIRANLLKGNVRAQPLQLNLRELMRVIPQMCSTIPQLSQQYIYRHILSMSTRYLAVDATPGGCTTYRNEIKYDVISFCSFCFKAVHAKPLI